MEPDALSNEHTFELRGLAQELGELPGLEFDAAEPCAPYTEMGGGEFFSQELGTLLRIRYNSQSYGQDGHGNVDFGTMRVANFEDAIAFFDGQVTLNDVQGLKVFRYADETRSQPRQWLPLRKTVADMPRRAQLSQAANRRYLEALASFDAQTPLSRLADKLCQAVQDEKGRRHRALNPLASQDACLLQVVARGEFTLTGFRNRDVRTALYGEVTCDDQRRRQASAVTRKLALLRAHGLIRKISDTHRYLLTPAGKTAIHAFLAARRATLDQLETAA